MSDAVEQYFSGIWKPDWTKFEHSGWSLVDKVNKLEPGSVLDIGCGFNDLKDNGYIDRDFNTGITVRQINDILMNFYRLDSLDGLLVMDVERESSGYRSGIKIGDIILKVNNKRVNSLNEITSIINEDLLKAGDEIKLIVLRNNKQIELNLSLDKGGF